MSTIFLGSFKKEGYQLNLTEAHSLLRKRTHDITHAHDPSPI